MNGFTLVSPKKKQYFFQPNDLLGTGAFGDVYKGTITDTNEIIAIKRVQNSVLEKYGDDFKKCLGDEANLLLQMNLSDKTVQIYDCFETQHHVCIIMEFCDGGTLEKKISKNPGSRVDEKTALKYFYQICQGLYVMHIKGMMHRDLKLENIFLKNGACKIGDFGFATRAKTSDQYVGSPEYMAPEIFDIGDGKTYDKQVDIWAMGIMLHEMLFGKRPFTGSQMQLPEIIKNTNYSIPDTPSVSLEVQDLLIRMLQKDPKKRIVIEDIMKHSVFAEFEEESKSNISDMTTSAGSKSSYKSSSFDPYESQHLQISVKKEMREKRVQRIYKKMDNFRGICKFFMNLCPNYQKFLTPGKEEFILDDLHPLFHYCLKYSAYNFSNLLEVLKQKDCPKHLLPPYDTDYWSQFLEASEYEDLIKTVEQGKTLSTKLFNTFTDKNLTQYLDRKGKKISDLALTYNKDLSIDCSASLQGKLHEASLTIQKLSISKQKYADDLQNLSLDIEFAKRILDISDNKIFINFEDFAAARSTKDVKISSFFAEMPYI